MMQNTECKKNSWRVVVNSQVKIRSQPSADGEEIGFINPGAIITGYQQDEWIHHSKGWSTLHADGITLLQPNEVNMIDIGVPNTVHLILAEPAFGLPTGNAKCLEILLYVSIAKIPYTFEYSSYPSYIATGTLPSLQIPGHDFIPHFEVIPSLMDYSCDIDQHMTMTEISEIRAFCSMVETELSLVDCFLLWGNKLESTTMDIYAKNLSYPVKSYLRRVQRKKVKSKLDKYGLKNTHDAQERARSCYTHILNYYTKQLPAQMRYFSRKDRPCSLDVCVASHLALHIYYPSKNNPFKKMLLAKFPILIQHAQDMLQTFAKVELIELIEHTQFSEAPPMPKLIFKSPKSNVQRIEDKKKEDMKKKEMSEKQRRQNLRKQIPFYGSLIFLTGFLLYQYNNTSKVSK